MLNSQLFSHLSIVNIFSIPLHWIDVKYGVPLLIPHMLIPNDWPVIRWWLHRGTLNAAQLQQKNKRNKNMRKPYFKVITLLTEISNFKQSFTKLPYIISCYFKRNSELSFAVNQTHTYIQITKYNLKVTCKTVI